MRGQANKWPTSGPDNGAVGAWKTQSVAARGSARDPNGSVMTGRTHHRQPAERWSDHDTSMCRAYLAALGRWVMAHHDDVDAKVVLPVGIVGAEELMRVLHALEIARQAGAR